MYCKQEEGGGCGSGREGGGVDVSGVMQDHAVVILAFYCLLVIFIFCNKQKASAFLLLYLAV